MNCVFRGVVIFAYSILSVERRLLPRAVDERCGSGLYSNGRENYVIFTTCTFLMVP